MKNYNTEPLSTLNADLNAAVTGVESLTGYATKDEITSFITEDALSDYATETYVREYVGEVLTGDISVDLSGYVPSTRTVNGHQLTSDVAVTSADLGLNSELWTFTLSDDTVVTKNVCVFSL
jgi:hypothetical protein